MTLRTGFKNLLNLLTHPLGLNIERHFGSNLELKQVMGQFDKHKINLLLDVGANTGQYSISMLKSGYAGNIISFEPLEDAYNILQKNTAKYQTWKAYKRCAIGNYNGTTKINISENRESSSILPINETHTNVVPSARYIGQSDTPIFTLDAIFSEIATSGGNICLKIDTQGFEDKVLAGAKESLKLISLLQLELSVIPLYDGGKTIDAMLPYLDSLGFEPVFFLPGFIDRTTGILQQLEGLFVNRY